MILGIGIFEASTIAREVLGLKFKVLKGVERVVADPRIRNLMASPIVREVLGLKFEAFGWDLGS